jgi:hypothetical protein
MLKLNSTSLVPPGGWKLVHPRSGATLVGGSYGDLVRNIRLHDRGNGWPTMTEQEIQHTVCSALTDNSGNCALYTPGEDPASAPAGRRRVTIDDAIRFAKVMQAGMLRKRDAAFVPQEEAERRAAICAVCPKNVTVLGCTACRNIVGWVSEVVGHKHTTYDGKLDGCEVCGCLLKVAVHVDLGIQVQGISEEMNQEFPDWCWKKAGAVTPQA